MMRVLAGLCVAGFVVAGVAAAEPRVEVVAESGLVTPFGIGFGKGVMYVPELNGNKVVRVEGGKVAAVVGTGEKGDGGDGGQGSAAKLNGPHSLVMGKDGVVYIADTWNNRVRKFDPKTGLVSAFAGTGKKGFAGDGGAAKDAEFGGIYCIALDHDQRRMYLADLDNRRVRMIDMATGVVTTVAGNGTKGVPADGAAAKDSPLVDPRAVAVDSKGNLYILERSGHALRVVDAAGKIRTVAGTGKKGLSGDGGPALAATMAGPKHLCVDQDDSVIIADTDNHVIRRYTPTDGRIVRVVGAGKKGKGGVPGPAGGVEMNQPHGVAVDGKGVLFICDSMNNRILRLVP